MARPSGAGPDGAGSGDRLDLGDVIIDVGGREVYVHAQPVALTRTQFDLLVALASSPGRVIRREDLMEQVWGHTFFADPDHLSVHIHHIRRALGDTADPPRYIQTVRGVGYKFLRAADPTPTVVTLHFDPDSILLAVDPHRPFLGWDPEEIVGAYFSLAGLDPSSTADALKAAAGGGGLSGPVTIVDGDGEGRTVLITVSVDVVDGTVLGYRGVITLPD